MYKCIKEVTKAQGKQSIIFASENTNLVIHIITSEAEAKIKLGLGAAPLVYDCIQEYLGEIVSPKVILEDIGLFRRFDWLRFPPKD